MVWIETHGNDNPHGIDLYSWYRNGTPESHKYERVRDFFSLLNFCLCKSKKLTERFFSQFYFLQIFYTIMFVC